jgi:anti-sigma regulatory factor (Ser/Thr protein kinase)
VDLNRWCLSIGPSADIAAHLAAGQPGALPSQVLQQAAGSGPLVQVAIELDLCGAWLTVANAGPCRPVAVRRAGWVDLRGHQAPLLGSDPGHRYCDDRVGLGPGDALVLVPGGRRPGVATGSAGHAAGVDGDDPILDVLLERGARSGRPSADDLDRVLPGADAASVPIVVLRVPADLGEDRHGQLAAALGVERHELELPGHPLGDLQPDLWSQPPSPPRTAQLHLPPSLAKAKEVRALLDRMLSSWRIADRVAGDDVALLASEVVTNAVRHSGTDATVTLRYTGTTVKVSVRDGSPAAPNLLPAARDRTGGRGMFLVDTLASAWGTTPTPDGKVVWFEVPVAAATA